jgi:hypothetical protein
MNKNKFFKLIVTFVLKVFFVSLVSYALASVFSSVFGLDLYYTRITLSNASPLISMYLLYFCITLVYLMMYNLVSGDSFIAKGLVHGVFIGLVFVLLDFVSTSFFLVDAGLNQVVTKLAIILISVLNSMLISVLEYLYTEMVVGRGRRFTTYFNK